MLESSGEKKYYELNIQPHLFVYKTNIGCYQNLAPAFETLEKELVRAGIKVTGFPYSIIMDDPRSVGEEMCRCELGYELCDGVNVKLDGFTVKEIQQQHCICTKFSGSIDKLPYIYDQLIADAEGLGYFVGGYPREIYIKHPRFAENEKLSNVEIQMPVVGR